MFCSLEIRGNYITWHRGSRGARSARCGHWFDEFLAKRFAAVEGSFGRDIRFAVPQRIRMRIYAVVCFLLSLKFYFVRELVAGVVMLSAASAVIFIPLLTVFGIYKAGQKLAQREKLRSVAMDKIIRFPGKDRQLEELLSRVAAHQNRSMILTLDPQKAMTRNGLILITAIPKRAS